MLRYLAATLILSGCSALVHDDNCARGPYETDLRVLRGVPVLSMTSPPQRRATDRETPIEIAQIRDGGYALFIGSFINEGMITWYGFDAGRRMFIAVLGGTRNHLKRLPDEAKMNASQFVRYTNAAGERRMEFVTTRDASLEQVREFACLANAALVAPESRIITTDVSVRRYVLRLDGKELRYIEGPEYDALVNFIATPLAQDISRARP